MYPLTQKAKEVVDKLVQAFDEPETLIDTITRATLIPSNSPCIKWSPTNRFIVALHGTGDARGFKQWKEINRYVKKGSKAIYILVPRIVKTEQDDSDSDERALVGFLVAPVFRIEDTDGEPIADYQPKELPKLFDLADSLSISVHYSGSLSSNVLGVYRHGEKKEIALYSHDQATFYHELAHALHDRTGKLRSGNSAKNKRDNETVAEISAAVLVHLFEGKEIGRQAISYIKDYGATKNRLLKLLPEIMDVVESAIAFESRSQEIQLEQLALL